MADFAGARADIADRRKRGETSVRRANASAAATAAAVPRRCKLLRRRHPERCITSARCVADKPCTTLGNIVVVGDVNPGTELVATGDIVVFGRLLGVAHAGAQGDNEAKVYALQLARDAITYCHL